MSEADERALKNWAGDIHNAWLLSRYEGAASLREILRNYATEARREERERCCKAMCEWCREGKPLDNSPLDPVFMQTHGAFWHVSFPDAPDDRQRVRCQASAIRALPEEK